MVGVFVHLYLPREFLQLENITLTVIGQYNKSKPQLVKPFFFLLFFIFYLYFCFFVCVFFLFVSFLLFSFLIFILFFFRVVLFYFVFLFCFVFFRCCCFVLFNGHFLVHCNCFLQFNLLVVLCPKPSVWVLIIWRTKLGFLKDIILKQNHEIVEHAA